MAGSFVANLFGRSPVRPLQKHFREAAACARELVPFIEAVLKGDWAEVEASRSRIVAKEQSADDLKKDVRLNLPDNLWMPVARADLLDLLMVQDRVANTAKDVSGIVIGRRMSFPAEVGDALMKLVRRCVDAVDQAERSVNELDELFETGFRGAEVELVEEMIDQLDAIEDDTDQLQAEVRAALFAREKELPPVDVVFMYQAIEWIGEVGDYAQRVGSRLQRMLAR
ncbi:TIGR00153 family protein [Alkalisalibacterium limincola]|uniref:TIGR00153 family protein n=1 Tax=Alkalisalibacterium limincola TaxID=2699169 RepID=A0A5C8KJ43_9GAMM|nr:TIGR00153 family protein [Alkalisalibacterium limincola]TXK60508.1 TIGR00153 family protein [Alkalisalibacterium limincola]